MKTKRFHLLALAGVLTIISGCTTYNVLRPLSPQNGSVTGTLSPTFKWEPARESGVTYDLVVYAEGDDITPVYYREGIAATSHTVETALAPDTDYAWSIRTRSGSSHSEWVKQETNVFTGLTHHRRVRMMKFKTPKQ